MFKRFLSVALLAGAAMVASPAYADLNSTAVSDAGFSKLTEAQKAEVVKAVADKAATNITTPVGGMPNVSADKVDKWLDVGEHFGKMIGGAAKEVGVAANDFVQSPVGMLTAGLIIWHYVGSVLVHVIGGLIVIVVGFGFLWFMIRRSVDCEIEYHPEKTNIFGNAKKTLTRRGALGDDAKAWYTALGFLTIIGSVITIFTY